MFPATLIYLGQQTIRFNWVNLSRAKEVNVKNLTVWLKELQIKKFGTIEALNEPYILSMALQNGLEGDIITERKDVNEIFPATFREFNRYIVTAVSPVFPNTRRGDFLNLFGKGLKLFGPAEINGPIQIHIAVMESDSDFRRIGDYLETALTTSKLSTLLEGVTTLTDLTPAKISIIMNAFNVCFGIVTGLLKENRDDIIQSFSYGEDFYQTESPYESSIQLQQNRYVNGSLLIEWE